MCDKCIELDEKIEQCRRVSGSIDDKLTIARLKELMAKLKAQKVAPHSDQKGQRLH